MATREQLAPAHDASDEQPTAIPAAMDIRSATLTVIAVLAVVMVLKFAEAVIIPIVLGVLISYALGPIVHALERLRLPRSIGAALLLVVLTGGAGWLAYSLRTQVTDIVEQMPRAAHRLRQRMEARRQPSDSAIRQVQQAANELEKAANAASPQSAAPGVQRVQVETPRFDVADYLMSGSVGVATAIGQLVVILFLVYFLLVSGDLYRRKLVKIAGPSFSEKKETVQILSEIDRQIAMFLFVQFFTSTVVAVASWLAFRQLGLQQAAFWGVAAGVFNSIPYVGPVVVTGGTTAVAFLQFDNIRMALLIGGVSLAITSIEGFLLTPWLTSRAGRMNAVAVFVNILFWGWVWNVWGMLLAVPMLMVIKAVCDHVEDFQPIGELIGE